MAASNDHDVVIDVDALHNNDINNSVLSRYTMGAPTDTPDALAASVVRKAIEVETIDQIETALSSSSTSSHRIPRTSADRIAHATPDVCPEEPVLASKYNRPVTSSSSLPAEKTPLLAEPAPAEETVLYLAYGSNMAAATFEGTRKIKPLSAVTVSAPTLRLTFDLPGIPYREPCFANTAFRKPPKSPVPIPAPPGPPGPIKPPSTTPTSTPKAEAETEATRREKNTGRPIWDGPLYGVVYEVTRDDYARIIATEGGGASYQDVLVPCFVVAPRMGVPEKPALPVPVKPFLAHTLCAPRLPSELNSDPSSAAAKGAARGAGDDGSDHDGDGDDGDDGDDSWFSRHWKAFLQWTVMRGRPDPDYAQPSKRYLGLLTTGAAEHELPQAYQDWLASLQSYTITSRRQTIGSILLVVASLPFILIILAVNWLPKKKGSTGRMSPAMAVAMGAFFKGIWWMYDHVFKPIFGDGERTEEKDGDDDDSTRKVEVKLK
ncbi:hypothetical protein SBRCBS47491_000906 [Sporothrix bragantina]|uniref:gamma-glutamylcyclotransferase n=1 Tax=Sporothrix bragantina TaxID=671064 RepID=A0ABP0AUI0_9PEZI